MDFAGKINQKTAEYSDCSELIIDIAKKTYFCNPLNKIIIELWQKR